VAGGGADGGGELVNAACRWRCLMARIFVTAAPTGGGTSSAGGGAAVEAAAKSRWLTVFGGADDALVPQRGQPVGGY
jgi:hypothetical protein